MVSTTATVKPTAELVALRRYHYARASKMARTAKEAKVEELASDRRRRDLLVAAYEMIAEKGLEGLRTRDIAARAGVNISTLYYYFGTKEALLEGVVLFVAEKFAGGGELTQVRPDATLREHFERAHETFRSNPQLAIVLQELALRAQRDPATRTALRPVFKFWNHQVEEVIRAEIAAGTIRRDAQAHVAELAVVVTSFIMGAMTQQGVNSRTVDFKALAKHLDGLLSGVTR
jgi:AcrR family transcriptional regulator